MAPSHPPRHHATPPSTPDCRSFHAAIRQQQTVIGGISLVFEQPLQPDSPLANSAGALVAMAARLASLATENHQLQRRLTRSGLLYELSRTLTSSLDIDVVLGLRPRWLPTRWVRKTRRCC